MWSLDGDDWCLKDGGGTESLSDCNGITYQKVTDEYKSWANNASTPGINTLMHETKDQTIKAFKEYYEAIKASPYKANNVPEIIGLPFYQNQYEQQDETEDVDSILPTRPAFNITDGGIAKVGEPNGPSLGEYSTLAHAASDTAPATSGSSSGSQDTASSQASSSSSDGKNAASLRSHVAMAGLVTAAAVALLT